MKRKAIPKTLHDELNDYSALLRVLRTNAALDVTTHLTNHGIARRNEVDGHLEIHGGKPLQEPERDQWTRWPLMLEDVTLPQWTLEDEVDVIANQVLLLYKLRPPSSLTASPSLAHHTQEGVPSVSSSAPASKLGDLDCDPDFLLHVRPLAFAVSRFLKHLLTLLAYHTPTRSASMQNRIDPMGWQSVVNVVVGGIYGLSNAGGLARENSLIHMDLLEKVIKRLERIYGPSSLRMSMTTKPMHMNVKKYLNNRLPSKIELSKFLQKAEDQLFSVAPLPAPGQRCDSKSQTHPSQKAKCKRKRRCSSTLTDSDSDLYVGDKAKRAKKKRRLVAQASAVNAVPESRPLISRTTRSQSQQKSVEPESTIGV